jgi:pyruvate dehydrogenase E1 component alpha subunit
VAIGLAEATSPPSATGSEPEEQPPSADLAAIYRTMLLARTMDERCLILQRQGRIGFYVPMMGQEAAQIACGWALRPIDWIFPSYRELGLALVRGVPIVDLLDQFFGNQADRLRGRQMPNHYGYRDRNFVVASSPVGTQISQAVGAAMAAQRRKDPIVTIAFFGDGATSSNDFHAGLNFGGVFQTPTIFFCQNNQWAISLPRERQTRSRTLAEKGAAYGVPGVVVDGTDVHAVYQAVRDARARAVAGQGPTLVEAQVYRMGPHSTSDDPRRYRTEDEVNRWKARDPILRLKQELLETGRLTEEQNAQLLEEVRGEVAKALASAESAPPVDPDSFLEDVLGVPTPLLEAERQELDRLLRDGVLKP